MTTAIPPLTRFPGQKIPVRPVIPVIILCLVLAFFSPAPGEEHRIKVGIYNFEPLVAVSENGKPSGFFTDILNHIACAEGWKIEYVPGSWQECLTRLETGEIDLLGSIGYSASRAEKFDFTKDFLFLDWGLVYQKKGDDIHTILNLEGKRISVLRGSIYTAGFRDLLNQFGIRCTLVEKDEYTQVFQAIDDGSVDAGINAQVYGMRIEGNYDIERTRIFFSPVKIGFAVKKGRHPELINTLDSWFTRLKADKSSIYYKLFDKWVGLYNRDNVPVWAKWLTSVIFCLLAVFLVFNIALKRQVRKKTRELTDLNQELRESETRFRQVAENIKEVFWIVSSDWRRVHYISPAYEEVWGRSCAELYANPRSWLDAIVEEDRADVSDYLDTTVRSFHNASRAEMDEAVFSEFRITRPDGSVHWILARGFPVHNTDGKIYRVAGISEDITGRREAEDRLRESHNLLEAIIHGTTDIVFVKDTRSRHLLVNRACAAVIGRPVEEIIGKNNRELFPPHIAPSLDRNDQEILLSEKATTREEQVITDGQERTFLSTRGVFRDTNGNIRGIFGISRDITERLLMDRELYRANKLEAIGTLTGGIAHDFNNILSIIVGNAELGMDNLEDWHPARKNMAEIETASMRAKELIRQLLSFSRRTDDQKRPLRIGEVIEEALEFIRILIPKNIEIIGCISEDTGMVLADTTHIHQIIINLCTNAAHAMEDGGQLQICLQNADSDHIDPVRFPAISSGQYVRLEVRDTGCGIPAEIRDRIFDPYFTTKAVGKGSGMGLAVVHGIVKSYDGTLFVESEPGKGTSFIIFLPVTDSEPDSPSEIVQDTPHGQGRILFVDDEPALADMGEILLKRLGYQVEARTDPREALQLFQENPYRFDLLVTDMTMPHMTGDILIREVRAVRPDIPVIISTGFSERMSEEKAQEMGIRKYIEKPLNRHEIAIAIRQILGKPDE